MILLADASDTSTKQPSPRTSSLKKRSNSYIAAAMAALAVIAMQTMIGWPARGASENQASELKPIYLPIAGAVGEPYAEIVGHYGGAPGNVTLDGELAYVSVGPRVVVIDFSSPESPVVLGESDILPGGAGKIIVVNDHAFVGGEALSVLQISDPTDPMVVASSDIPTRDLDVVDGIAYIANEAGLHALDVSSPSAPRWLSSVPGRALSVRIVDSMAYLIERRWWSAANTWMYSLSVIDVHDAASPMPMVSITPPGYTSGSFRSLEAVGDHVYVIEDSGDGTTQVRIFTVTGWPGFLEPAGSLALPLGWSWGLSSVSEHILVAASNSRLLVIDAGNPDGPEIVHQQFVPEGVVAMSFGNAIGVITRRDDKVGAVALGDQLALAELGAIQPGLGSIDALAASAGFLFAINDHDLYGFRVDVDGLRRLDGNAPFESSRETSILVADGNLAFVAAWPRLDEARQNLGVVAASDQDGLQPSEWVEIANGSDPSSLGLTDSGRYLLMASLDPYAISFAISVVNGREQASLRAVGEWTSGEAWWASNGLRLTIADGRAYVWSSLSIDVRVFDLAKLPELSKPRVVDLEESLDPDGQHYDFGWDLPGPVVHHHNGLAYLMRQSYSEDLVILISDLRDLANPRSSVARLDLAAAECDPYPYSCSKRAEVLGATGFADGMLLGHRRHLSLVDLSRPEEPSVVAEYPLPPWWEWRIEDFTDRSPIVSAGQLVALAGGRRGLLVLRLYP